VNSGKGHSLPGEHRGMDKSGYREEASEQEVLDRVIIAAERTKPMNVQW